jgi:hypothetical protein
MSPQQDAGNGAELSPEAALLAHLSAIGLTEDEIEAARVSIPSGFAAMARTGLRPTTDEFRMMVASKPSARPIRMDAHPLADLFPVMTFQGA